MLPLFPPEYPDRPDAPLLSMGPAFSEEIARSLLRAIWHENPEQPHETNVRTAAGLTMLEAFHPRDQLETMLAAQCVAAHCAMMDNFHRAAHPDTPPQLAIKLRASVVAMNRMFCLNLRELAHLQSRPLPSRPGQPPVSPTPPPTPTGDGHPPARPCTRAKTASAGDAPPVTETPPPPCDPIGPPSGPLVALEDLPDIPEDIETRPDGTPGNLAAYAPKVPVIPYIPREAPIMVALATRPKPWKMVNVPRDQAAAPPPDAPATPPEPEPPEPQRPVQRGPIDLRERVFTGDALARFAATRLDPNAPVEPLQFGGDACTVELELISTGGDPSAEAEQAAMKAAHPEGKPIVTFRYGTQQPFAPPLPNGKDDAPPNT